MSTKLSTGEQWSSFFTRLFEEILEATGDAVLAVAKFCWRVTSYVLLFGAATSLVPTILCLIGLHRHDRELMTISAMLLSVGTLVFWQTSNMIAHIVATITRPFSAAATDQGLRYLRAASSSAMVMVMVANSFAIGLPMLPDDRWEPIVKNSLLMLSIVLPSVVVMPLMQRVVRFTANAFALAVVAVLGYQLIISAVGEPVRMPWHFFSSAARDTVVQRVTVVQRDTVVRVEKSPASKKPKYGVHKKQRHVAVQRKARSSPTVMEIPLRPMPTKPKVSTLETDVEHPARPTVLYDARGNIIRPWRKVYDSQSHSLVPKYYSLAPSWTVDFQGEDGDSVVVEMSGEVELFPHTAPMSILGANLELTEKLEKQVVKECQFKDAQHVGRLMVELFYPNNRSKNDYWACSSASALSSSGAARINFFLEGECRLTMRLDLPSESTCQRILQEKSGVAHDGSYPRGMVTARVFIYRR